MPKRCERQLHVWLSEREHAYLTARAEEDGATLGAVVRALIRRAICEHPSPSISTAPGRNGKPVKMERQE